MQGLAGVLYLLAILNVFVGVFNMFPLLPLDGGHAAIATYERVREIGRGGRRYFTDVARLMPFTMGVIVVLLFLFMSGPVPRHHQAALGVDEGRRQHRAPPDAADPRRVGGRRWWGADHACSR